MHKFFAGEIDGLEEGLNFKATWFEAFNQRQFKEMHGHKWVFAIDSFEGLFNLAFIEKPCLSDAVTYLLLNMPKLKLALALLQFVIGCLFEVVVACLGDQTPHRLQHLCLLHTHQHESQQSFFPILSIPERIFFLAFRVLNLEH